MLSDAEKLDRVHSMLSKYEVASQLIDVFGSEVVGEAEMFVAKTVVEKLGTIDVDNTARDGDAAIGCGAVEIGEIDGKESVIVLNGGAQE